MAGQTLQRGAQFRIADAVCGGLDTFCCRGRQVDGVTDGSPGYGRRLYLENNACQVGEFVESDQLPLQTLLLVAQARGPVTVGHDQQQAALAP